MERSTSCGLLGVLVLVLALLCVETPLRATSQSFPDLCSFDWHATLSVNGTKNGQVFGPEPAEEWSSFSSQQFRVSLPQHNYFDPILNVGEGSTISNDNPYETSLWYVWTSQCCSVAPPGGPFEDCSQWFSCNILAIGVQSEVCLLVAQWQYEGQEVINGQECDHWVIYGTQGPEFHEFWVTSSDQTPVLYHWKADTGAFNGINEFEEWLTFESFDRGTLPSSAFDVKDVAGSVCYPLPKVPCNDSSSAYLQDQDVFGKNK